ncbi:uncharacterized protein CCOS01_16933 [Colletotrichum costaricense]|uniref:3'-5' exonuclease domain-containing protein n=1 Tax=Colletotrichum costaricense TaxID=1209916 RepID=A0AAI9YEH9_9PEZI|nr:uncharacterized protein CCOS01_16933 [Colletotrichum costaricense]KAK1503858.1 hypothetical protein CCOS01_16933 [Colletotrichum costaricense]
MRTLEAQSLGEAANTVFDSLGGARITFSASGDRQGQNYWGIPVSAMLGIYMEQNTVSKLHLTGISLEGDVYANADIEVFAVNILGTLRQDSSIFEASLHSDKSSRAVVCEAKGTGVKPICHKSGRATMLLSKRSVDSSTAYHVWKMSARWYWRVNQSVSLSAVKEKNGVVLDYNSVLFMGVRPTTETTLHCAKSEGGGNTGADSTKGCLGISSIVVSQGKRRPWTTYEDARESLKPSFGGRAHLLLFIAMSAGDIRYSLVDSAESMSNLLTHVYLVDIHTMQSTAFSTAVGGTTFKQILESPDITKVFFDVRNDSDALFHHFQVKLSGIEDVQLMENAARPRGQRRYLNGLDKCIGLYAPLSPEEKAGWKAAKEAGLNLFHPSRGGSYEVFNSRPMSTPIGIYCINDVRYLPHLREALWRQLDEVWRQKVVEETKKRILESQSPSYEPQSETKKFGPWGRA